MHRSLHELKALQTNAAIALTLPPEFMQRVQPLASTTQIAKRTQALATADRLNARKKNTGGEPTPKQPLYGTLS
jgi:hypothetical protein